MNRNFIFIKSLAIGLFLSTWGYSQTIEENIGESVKYRNIGPNRGGRATTVTGVTQEKGTFYMGASGGGLWKTTNYGNSWNNVSDGFFATGSMGAVRVAPTDSKTIYAGTGSDGIRSNIIVGKGVYKSENAGKTWKHVGLEATGHIGAVEIHPSNKEIVFVAAIGQAHSSNPERGLFRTKDGGNSWEKVLFINDSVGIADVEFAPGDPNTVYAAAWQVDRKPWTIKSGPNGGIYKSTNGGDSWRKLSNGLPSGLVGKADLAVSPANPSVLYALIEALPGSGLYRSDDKGESFKLINDQSDLLDRPFYYCNVDVNPKNENSVFVNSTSFWKSFDGGKSFSRSRTAHSDNHDMWINPSDTSIFIQSNDGGASITLDYGKSWSTQNNQPTAEVYQVEVDDQHPYWVYAGQQDNTTISIPSLPPFSAPGGDVAYWMEVGGCETGPAVPKPGNPDIVYSNCKGRFGVYNKKTGQEMQYYVGAANIYGHKPTDLQYRFQRVSPVHVSPHNPNVVYHTSQFVHRTKDGGINWETISPDLTANEPNKQVISGTPITRDVTGEEYYSTIYSIRESNISPGLLWVGSNDGLVHTSRDSGKNWVNVTPKKAPKGGRVDSVEPSPHTADKAYISILMNQLGDWKPYVFKTDNYGKSWELLTDGSNGIPENVPVRVVREDPVIEGVLYAGTEFGMYISINDGKSWEKFQLNLPITPITDVKFYRNNLIISTMGRGFWIMDDMNILQNLFTAPLSDDAFFKPYDAIGYRYSSSNSVPEFPEPGAVFGYYLKNKGSVAIEISDYRGKVIRSYQSKDASTEPKTTTSMATGFSRRSGSRAPSSEPGMHTFTWDLRHTGSWDKDPSRNGTYGPFVAPGEYAVKLTINGNSTEYHFNVLSDPRLQEAGIKKDDLIAQENLNLEIRDLQSRISFMAQTVKDQVEAMEKDGKKVKGRLLELHQSLNTAEGTYMTPMLDDQISYLASMMKRADQRPGKDAVKRFEVLRDESIEIKKEFDKEFPKADWNLIK